jgi:molybdenum cofactor biosynthesis protein B
VPGHAHHKHDVGSVECAVITVSDTRSGQRIRALLREHGHAADAYRIVKDEPRDIVAALAALPDGVRAVILNGGTGLARRDTTYEAVSGLLDKEITGFGELFRTLSYEQIGAAAMLSRATAGIAGRRAVFVVPGSTAAVELAMTKLILPELGHIVGLLEGD